MPKIDAGLACPVCDMSGVTSRLYQNTPSLAILCEGNDGHKWNDTEVQRQMKPRRLEVMMKPPTVQGDHVQLMLKLPASVKRALIARFGDDPSASVASVLAAASEGGMLFLNEGELQRIKERTGLKPTTGAELYGHVWAMGEQIKELTSELERLKRLKVPNNATEGNRIPIDLGDHLAKAMNLANESHESLEEFIGAYVRTSLENDWIAANA